MGRLFLREQSDINRLLKIIADNDLTMNPQAIEYACQILSDDWLTLFDAGGPNCFCDLSFGKIGGVGYSLPQWIDAVTSLYNLRGVKGIDEQARRLCISSHERLDTALVLTVASRYQGRHWAVAFEPNGKGCSDLRVAQGDQGFYIEVKRENTQKHDRLKNIRATSDAILGGMSPALFEWLEKNNCRIQVRFLRGISTSLAPRICNELRVKVPHAPTGIEQPLTLPKDGEFVVLRRDSEQHFSKGFISGIVRIKQHGVAVQANDPRNMPVQVVCEWLPNLTAVGDLIKKATRQLQNDGKLDSDAKGFIVMQARGGKYLGNKIEERFLPNFPACCLGVTLLSESPFGSGQIVARDGLDAPALSVMSHAANVDYPSPRSESRDDVPYLSIIIVTPEQAIG